MLFLIGIVFRLFGSPNDVVVVFRKSLVDARAGMSFAQNRHAFGSLNDAFERPPRAGDLSLLNDHSHAVFEVVFDGRMIVSLVFNRANGTSADALAPNRPVVLRPAADVDVVNHPVDNRAARHPRKAVEIEKLVLQSRFVGIVIVRDFFLAAIDENAGDVADSAVVNLVDAVFCAEVFAVVEPRHDFEPLFLGDFPRLGYVLDAGRVDGERLFQKDVNSPFDRVTEMNVTKRRRRGQNNDVSGIEGVDTRLVPVQAVESGDRVRVIVFQSVRASVFYALKQTFRFELERVRHGNQLNGAFGIESLQQRARPAASAADNADVYSVVFSRMNGGNGKRGRDCRSSCGSFKELTAGCRHGKFSGGLKKNSFRIALVAKQLTTLL